MSTEEYDVIVLGGGPVGENVADRAVQGGLRTVIVESELVGGECSYWACMPSKTLLRAGQVLRSAQHVPGVASAVTGDLDVPAVFARRNWMTGDWTDDGQVSWLDSAGIDLVRGHGRLSGEREVTVTQPDGSVRVLRARHAVAVSTGTDAAIPPIPGLRELNPWTSREATSAQSVPESLVILGGGVVGVEMATAYAAFGSEVTVVCRSTVLSDLDPIAGELVADGLRELGVNVVLHAAITGASRDENGVTVETDKGVFTGSEVLVATGRRPRSGDIGLETVGLEPGRYLDVDETMLVPGFDWLYGVGDINGRVLLTHQGKYQARAAGDVIVARAKGEAVDDAVWGRHVASADHAAVPQVVFSEPEVAAVGLSERQAREAGYDITVVEYGLGGVAAASILRDDYKGKARMIVDDARQVVLGVTFIGPDVAELLQAATHAVVGEIPISRLWHAVPAYPTMNEIWLRLLETYGRQSA